MPTLSIGTAFKSPKNHKAEFTVWRNSTKYEEPLDLQLNNVLKCNEPA